ncbi:MAG: PAS domain S-box protein, partial [Rhodothermales bacterium]|nr:PAS domain S-box protein [Rhodothermales bacterium]
MFFVPDGLRGGKVVVHYDLLLIASISLRLVAGGWAVRLLVRQRDWRLGFLAAVIFLMAVRPFATLVNHTFPHSLQWAELPGLIVSLLIFPAVFFVDQLLMLRREAAERLAESEEKYRTLVEDQEDLVRQFAPDLTLTFVNRAYSEYFGREADELIGTSFLELIPEEHREHVRANYQSFGGDRRVASIVHPVVRPGGDVRWQEWTDHAFLDDDGRAIGFQSLGRDITDRKLAQDALRHSEELNRGIVEALPGGIVQVAPDGRILRANDEAHRILGITADRLQEANIMDLEPWTVYETGVTCPKEEFPAAKCLSTGLRQPPITLGTLRPSGEISWAVYTAVPVFDSETDELDGAVLTFLDITDRRLAEEALRDS